MKILFSNPPWWTTDESGLRHGVRNGSRWPFTHRAKYKPDRFEFGQYCVVPFFGIHAAAYTKKLMPEAEIVVRDSIARGEGYTAFSDYMQKYQPDFMVVETATPSLEHDLRLIGYYPNTKIILAGTIDCEKHQNILDTCPNVHAIVQGEYDKQIALAVHGKRGVYQHNLLTAQELKDSPLPIYDEACALHYYDGCPKGQKVPQLQMWTSRGCPFLCSYCLFPSVMTGNDPEGKGGRKVRFHSMEYVEEHIRWRKSLHNYQCVYFDDDTVNLSEKHTLQLCEVMNRIKLPWSAMCRADTIKRDVWKEMKRSGCFGVKLGMETSSQRVLDTIVNKRLNINEAVETCEWLEKELDMRVHTTWMLGNPGETVEEMQQTVELINRMYKISAHSTHQLSGCATLEGTPLHTLTKKGHLEKYAGAEITKEFEQTGDGQKRIEQMMR